MIESKELKHLRKVYWKIHIEQWEQPEIKRGVLLGLRTAIAQVHFAQTDESLSLNDVNRFITDGRPQEIHIEF